jgi:hypothetical protein
LLRMCFFILHFLIDFLGNYICGWKIAFFFLIIKYMNMLWLMLFLISNMLITNLNFVRMIMMVRSCCLCWFWHFSYVFFLFFLLYFNFTYAFRYLDVF